MHVVLPILAQAGGAEVELPYVKLAIGTTLFLMALIGTNYFTQSGVIARATTKEALRQPLFLLLLGLGLMIILTNFYVPFFSMGEDTKMFIDCGLSTALICSLLICVWTASLSVADEIDGKTAMTLLSKPINRRQFVFGKYLGVFQSAFIMIAVLGVVLAASTYFKFGFDQNESGQVEAELFFFKAVSWLPFDIPYLVRERFNVAITVFPALALITMEVAVMTAVAVAISTRMPMLVNMSVCLAVFVIGHLTPILAQSNVKNLFVKFFASLFATVFPVLEHFNMSAAVSTGKVIPAGYIGWAFLYCAAYVTALIMLAFLMFEDRDLA
ncbi:MAG: ABC transporter permease subunit [Planctomycetaceae bacterium]|nr:ABC transporter permease subunit [Planctomycetaceae bacterium]